ncbi:hypothetical protein [Mycobacterium hodleri]|uniref:Uncharacterized protein n=1 Tax=Mycolicibacterium hodleri TaxID=49897 RepID=A0A502ECS9_9MYCO|nr:hypothetical protein EAH80_10220 [Mycolicibacterium hodleri]
MHNSEPLLSPTLVIVCVVMAQAAGEDAFTYGLLHQQEDDLPQRSREQLDDALIALKRSVRKAH